MKNVLIIVLLLAVGTTGYWLGQRKVGAGGTVSVTAPPAGEAAAGRKILYYRNPMGLPDTSPTPKKDSMGMDYLPVYEGEAADDAAGVTISPAKVQKLGVRTEAVVLRELSRPVRAVGRVEVDERRVFAVAPKFEGWIERLHANATGQPVTKGQPLFEVYSPELVSAQREYQVAAQGAGTLAATGAGAEAQASLRQLAEAALARLRNWDVPVEQVERLQAGGEAGRTLTFRSPVAGVILEKKALQGQRFMPGETLYQIADVSAVWVVADVFERDIAAVKVGQPVDIGIDAYPGSTWQGRVTYVYPTLNAQTRTVPVRIELPNPRGTLRPAMYAKIEVNVGAGGTAGRVLTVPISAVLDGGTVQRVLVQTAPGRFEPREVVLGQRNDDYVEVRQKAGVKGLSGVKAGELVVVAANFLIDSESNLKAALAGMQETSKTAVSHQAVGRLDSIETDGSVMVTHEPVASLHWPQMTMGFVPANASLIDGLKPGAAIRFEFVERKPGEWVITKLEKR